MLNSIKVIIVGIVVIDLAVKGITTSDAPLEQLVLMALYIAAHVNDADNGMNNLSHKNQNNSLQEGLLDLVPVIKLLIILIILNAIDRADQIDSNHGRHYHVDAK